MDSVRACLRALARRHTYDVRRNFHFWLGFVWGLPIPLFALTLDLGTLVHVAAIAHPMLFAIAFGAMGTVRRDLEERNRTLIETLREQAMTDPLTGLYNRRYAMEEFKNRLARARRREETLTVALLDVDGFKQVNDTQGHPVGDRVLCMIANELKNVARESDLVARYGGDEFLLLVDGELSAARGLVRRAVEAVDAQVGLGLSAGIAGWPGDGATPDELIAAADRRLARRKKEVHTDVLHR